MSKLMYEVTLKPSHPTGVYHRAGMEFTKSGPVELDAEAAAAVHTKKPRATVLELLQKDDWLIVKEVEKKDPPKDGGKDDGKGKDK
jgi:hypothetical protein